MADDLTLNVGTGGAKLRTEELAVTLQHVQHVKVVDVSAGIESGHGLATQTTLASLLTAVSLLPKLTDTLPVSLTDSPLPTGAATQATLALVLGELQSKADLTETQPVSVSSLPLPSGAGTEATLASILSELQQKTEPSQVQTVVAGFATRSDTYVAATNGVTVDASAKPMQSFSIQVKSTGGIASVWDVRLEGSLDGVNFDQILQHTNATGDGELVVSGSTMSPCLYFRSRCASITLGLATNIVVTILGKS